MWYGGKDRGGVRSILLDLHWGGYAECALLNGFGCCIVEWHCGREVVWRSLRWESGSRRGLVGGFHRFGCIRPEAYRRPNRCRPVVSSMVVVAPIGGECVIAKVAG